MLSGERMRCVGTSTVSLRLEGGKETTAETIVTSVKPMGFEFILGMTGIVALGGVEINNQGLPQFRSGSQAACGDAEASFYIEEKDFTVVYDAKSHTWTAAWKWADNKAPETLWNTKEEYSSTVEARAEYERELDLWIRNGWLVPYDEKRFGPARALIPLMAVTQRSKGTVRPVMDFRQLNEYIDNFTANSDVCAHKLREWRRQGTNVSILDLRKANLQIHVDQTLWPYQTVIVKGRRYALTRLGFGLNVAPTIMKVVVNHVLSLTPDVQKATSAYIDDIFVNEDVVSADTVKSQLAKYGLSCKPPERLANGARVLGLKVWGEQDKMMWSRGHELGEPPKRLTRRTVFSYCGEMVGHYPVCGWLRTATALIKREANNATSTWDEPIRDGQIRNRLLDVVKAMKSQDPVRGRWDVSGEKAKVWVDASALALGVALEVDGAIIEDGAWLRHDDAGHINMAELDAMIKGLNLALSWQLKDLQLMTDSLTVYRWIDDALSGKTRLKTKAASEMLIRRRVAIVLALVQEYDLNLTVTLVKSAENKADDLTRVPRQWLAQLNYDRALAYAAAVTTECEQVVAEVHHAAGHPGVRRTLYFAKRRDPTVSKRVVSKCVRQCDICQSIDPAPMKWKQGQLEVSKTWHKLSCDVTHYKGSHYLTLIDCGPTRFAIWRPLRFCTAMDIAEHLEQIFLERGAPEELLVDNDPSFRSQLVARLTKRWGVRLRFRCAYVPSGNGIVERCHRTIKVIAARKNCPVAEAVYLYNMTPRNDCSAETAPANAIYRYVTRVRGVDRVADEDERVSCPYKIGDMVWVRTPTGRCDTQYEQGTVTRIISEQAVEINGIPRHVRDIRHRSSAPSTPSNMSLQEHEDDELLVTIPVQVDETRQVTPQPMAAEPGQREDAESPQIYHEDRRLRRSERLRRRKHCPVCDFENQGGV